ncbi:MAG: bifunctional 5,10-methylenetetrahydrofolate dehydrogenase/5,10-methenyltetrahydrofolate cyclohydrolase [Candidatus Saccharimonadales bacterium]
MLLKGSELAGYIKAQQAQMVRSFSYSGKTPQLDIISVNTEVVSNKYVELKQQYGEDIGVVINHHQVDTDDLVDIISDLNSNTDSHGIIVQLPLPEDIKTNDINNILDNIDPRKDVDGLGSSSIFDPATPTAILWLLAGYDINLEGKRIGIVGQGRLVGKPLTKILTQSGYQPMVCDEDSNNLEELMEQSDIVITATGQPGLITNELVKVNQVLIDAGTADDNGSLIGDVEKKAHNREDIKISPVPGGVGPLTVTALFANVIEAFRIQVLE